MIKKQLVTLVTIAGIFTMTSGCQTMNEKASTAESLESKLNERSIALDAREAELDKKENDLNAQQDLLVEGNTNWRSILCEPNVSTARIVQIQKSLKEKGFNPGRIDGFIGNSTMRAVNEFQKENALPINNYIDIETIKMLGISGVSGH